MNTNYFLNLVSGNVYGSKKSPAIPTKYYIGLSSSEPNVGGSGVTEPSGDTGYARTEIRNLGAPINGVVTNQYPIDFSESLTSWGTMRFFVIYDAPTNGNLLSFGRLTNPRTVEPATVMTITTGALKLSAINPA